MTELFTLIIVNICMACRCYLFLWSLKKTLLCKKNSTLLHRLHYLVSFILLSVMHVCIVLDLGLVIFHAMFLFPWCLWVTDRLFVYINYCSASCFLINWFSLFYVLTVFCE